MFYKVWLYFVLCTKIKEKSIFLCRKIKEKYRYQNIWINSTTKFVIPNGHEGKSIIMCTYPIEMFYLKLLLK